MKETQIRNVAGLTLLSLAVAALAAFFIWEPEEGRPPDPGRGDQGRAHTTGPLPSITGRPLLEQARLLDRWIQDKRTPINPEVRELLKTAPAGIKLRCLDYLAASKDKGALGLIRSLGKDHDLRVRLSVLGARRDLEDFDEMKAWVEALKGTDPELVMHGAFAISMSHRREHIPALEPLLQSPHRAVRIEVAFAFAELHWKKISKRIGHWAYSRDYLLQEAGVFAWLYDPDKDVALDELTKLMWSPDEKLADLAIHLFPRIKSPRVITICKEARRSPHHLVRMWAVLTLRQIGTKEALAALPVFQDDPSSSVQHFLKAKSIKGLDDPLNNPPEPVDPPPPRGEAPEPGDDPALGGPVLRHPRHAGDLKGLLKDLSSPDYQVRSHALKMIDRCHYGSLDQEGFARVAALERDPAPKMREKAMDMISRKKMPAMLPVLLRMADDPVAKVRQRAVYGLSIYQDAQARAAIHKALQDGSLDVEMVALLALARYQDLSLVGPIERAATAQDFSMRAAAMHALGKVGSPQVVPLLARGASDKAGWVRLSAAYALGSYKTEGACKALDKALEDPSYYVRAVALESCVKICPSLARDILAREGKEAAPWEPLLSMIKSRKGGDPAASEIPFIKRQCAHEYLSHTHDQIEGYTLLGKPTPTLLEIDFNGRSEIRCP